MNSTLFGHLLSWTRVNLKMHELFEIKRNCWVFKVRLFVYAASFLHKETKNLFPLEVGRQLRIYYCVTSDLIETPTASLP